MGVPRNMWAITINTGYGVTEEDDKKGHFWLQALTIKECLE